MDALFDNDFLKRFVSHVSGKRYCIYSDLGSGVFYASLLGAEPIKIDLPSIVVNKGNHHITEKMISEVSAFDDEFVKSMTTQKVNEEMGLDFMLSPSQMRALIIKNYFTFSFAKVFIKRSLSVPYRWVRNMYHRQSFQPGLIGLFVNPFYFARKALYQAINAVSGEMTGRLLDVGCGFKALSAISFLRPTMSDWISTPRWHVSEGWRIISTTVTSFRLNQFLRFSPV
jgi:hypothetical protein